VTETLAEARADARQPFHVALLLRATAAGGVQKAAAGLILVQLAWRAWAGGASFFAADDFAYLYSAEHHPLGWHYLMTPYNGHLMPGQFLVVWLMQHVAPLSWTTAASILLILQVAVDVAVWRLLRDVFGMSPGVLIPLAIFLFSPLTLASYLWWAAGLQMLPLLLAMALTLRAHLAYFRTGRAKAGWRALGAYAFGLVFWEKALLILPLVVGFSLLFCIDRRRPHKIRLVFGRRWRLWLGYVALTGGYLVVYASTAGWPLSGRTSTAAKWGLIREMLASAFLPGLYGGPWGGHQPATGLVPVPPHAAFEVLVVLTAALVAFSVWVRRGAGRAWVLLLGYLALEVYLLAGGRLHLIGPIIGRDTRYIADAVLVAALAIGLALLPMRDEGSDVIRHRTGIAELTRPSVVGLVVLLYVSSSWVTTASLVHDTEARPTKKWVTTARADMRSVGGHVHLYDAVPPKNVMSPLMFSSDRYSRLLAGAPEAPIFNQPAERLYLFDDAGHLRPLRAGSAVQALPGPVQDCGYNVNAGGATIPLSQPLFNWSWIVRIAYYTSNSTKAELGFGVERVPVEFVRGLHELYVPVTARFDRVEISGMSGASVVCISGVGVGLPTTS
jgi:hypothetical protein